MQMIGKASLAEDPQGIIDRATALPW